jgi:hypothetical protein
LNIVHIIIGKQKKPVFHFYFNRNKSNFSGFDIGNHFCEFLFDYQSSKEWPFFKVNFTLYPNETQQVNTLEIFNYIIYLI